MSALLAGSAPALITLSSHHETASAHLLRALAEGRMPVHRAARLTGVVDDAPALLPVGSTLLLDSGTGCQRIVVAELPGLVVQLSCWPVSTYVEVVGADAGLVDAMLAGLVAAIGDGPPRPRGSVRMSLWSWQRNHAEVSEREVEAPTWADVAGNYAGTTAAGLAPLMTATGMDGRSGRLVLWHGVPGTGKTTAVRALSRQWDDWCQVHYAADPEKLFADPGYLLGVAGADAHDRARHDPGAAAPWRLVVAEDCDEYLHADAKQRAGASLGRLLNLCDGILGHGLRVVVLLTTNEDLTSLHPAVTRPGRCLSQVEFAPLPPEQARAWLRDDSEPPRHPVTLAELYALRDRRVARALVAG